LPLDYKTGHRVKPVKLTPINEALALLIGSVRPVPEVQRVPLRAALGRILAERVQAEVAVPAFDNSAMDGYVLHTDDCIGELPSLPVIATVAAGHPLAAISKGTAARIFTGAPIPDGANTVVMQENTQREGDSIILLQTPRPCENIRKAGHDIAAGSTVLSAGKRLLPQDIGLLASLGLTELAVARQLTVAIVNTGDEVVAPGTPLRPGQLYDSNSFTLAALLEGLGIQVLKKGIVADSLDATVQALREAAAEADCVISTGGVSVGDADFVKAAVEKLGALSLWKLAIKPGKPFSFGHVDQRPFFGLPGNPVAVFVTFVTLVKPFLLALQGGNEPDSPLLVVKASFAISEASSRQEYLRVRVRAVAGELPVAELYSDQGSSVLTSLSWADGLVVVPVQTPVQPGQLLQYLPFRGVL
jgi:molybdopterin molybdotransferase